MAIDQGRAEARRFGPGVVLERRVTDMDRLPAEISIRSSVRWKISDDGFSTPSIDDTVTVSKISKIPSDRRISGNRRSQLEMTASRTPRAASASRVLIVSGKTFQTLASQNAA